MDTNSSNPLRILHIILSLRPTNGQYNEHCLPMMNERKITICTFFKTKITPPAQITLFDGDNTVRGFIRALRAALKYREHDVIHVHTPHAGVLLLTTFLLSGLYRKLMARSVHTVQNSFQSFQLRHKLMFIPSFAFFQYLVFCSNASYDSFPFLFKWLCRGSVHVIQNAVDIDRIDGIITNQQSFHEDYFGIVTVGLIKIKNPFTVLEAFHQCNDPVSKLVYLGSGNLKPLIAEAAKKLGLQEEVELTGMIERNKVFEYYASADLFVSASRGEGLPVAVLEAMACRCPVVLSDIPPHREVAEGVGFIPLIQPDDVRGFKHEIEKFRDMPVSERTKVGRKCRKLVEERFSLTTMHAGYAEVYAQITRDQRPSLN